AVDYERAAVDVGGAKKGVRARRGQAEGARADLGQAAGAAGEGAAVPGGGQVVAAGGQRAIAEEHGPSPGGGASQRADRLVAVQEEDRGAADVHRTEVVDAVAPGGEPEGAGGEEDGPERRAGASQAGVEAAAGHRNDVRRRRPGVGALQPLNAAPGGTIHLQRVGGAPEVEGEYERG